MKKFSFLCVAVVSASLAFSSIANAATTPGRSLITSTQMTPAGIDLVQYDGRHHRPNYGHHSRPDYRPHGRPNYRPHPHPGYRPHSRPGYGHGGYHARPGYYHGHQGSRHKRRGYRRHSDGWWYPIAAFTAGAIIGGAAAQ